MPTKASASAKRSHASPSGAVRPNSRCAPAARSRKSSSVISLREVPTILKVSGMSPSSMRWNIPGRSLRRARSPLAPKSTMTWSSGVGIASAWGPAASRAVGPPKGASDSATGRAIHMAAELLAHRREDLAGEVRLPARFEALEERGGEHAGGHALLDRRLDRPPALTRVGHVAGEALELRRLREGGGEKVEQPRGDYAAAPPDLADRGHVEVVAVVLGVAQRSGLGVAGLVGRSHVRVAQDVQALRVRRHEPVLDAVVHHLHEVPGATRPAVQPTLLARRQVALTAWRS